MVSFKCSTPYPSLGAVALSISTAQLLAVSGSSLGWLPILVGNTPGARVVLGDSVGGVTIGSQSKNGKILK